ncbi:BRO family protein [Chondrinema litorale]|uniref:BRO family protein n=1 Tax=Chondrinema litorale TaxID=2994555 RepID=UPI0025436D19|nr:BRO family protein [Chondrinema litorale]UZR97280.1 BRO family protein [Chondrinema litorale]
MELIELFNNEIRRVWDEETQQWYLVIVDVVAVLSESKNPAGYLRDLRRRDLGLKEGWGQIATPLVVETTGGKQKINCANQEGILRIIQSIPSKNAEPFKLWLAKVGSAAIDERQNKRLAYHKKLKETQEKFYKNIKERGVDDEGFLRVVKAGDESLFDGADMNEKYSISKEDDPDDFMDSILLTGKTFATEISNHTVKQKNLQGEKNISEEHKASNKEIRSVLMKKEVTPEELPPDEDIKKMQSPTKPQKKNLKGKGENKE